MSLQVPITIKNALGETIINSWFETTLHNSHLAIPQQHFKDGEQLTIHVHPENCILLYPISEWKTIEAKLNALPPLTSKQNALSNLLKQLAIETIHNQQISIPESYLKYANLVHKVIWAVADTHVILYSPETFQQKILKSE
jgi:DNA-binding transcriptional regulator/RsmH inhibitor MraZ